MDKPKFLYVTYINTTPEKLWEALTTTDVIRQYWYGRINQSDWTTGAALESRSPEGKLEWRGTILESQPPRRLAYTFEVEGRDEPASRVLFEIEPSKSGKGGLKLTVTHDEFPAESKVYPGIQEGWPGILSMLKSLLETGRALELDQED